MKNTDNAATSDNSPSQLKQAWLSRTVVIWKSLAAFFSPHYQQKHKHSKLLFSLNIIGDFSCFCFGLRRPRGHRGYRRKYLKACFQAFSPVDAVMPQAFVSNQSVFNVIVK